MKLINDFTTRESLSSYGILSRLVIFQIITGFAACSIPCLIIEKFEEVIKSKPDRIYNLPEM